MKHHLSLISIFAAFLAVSVFPMQASADALDDLLEEVRTGTLQKSDQATQREQQFGSSADQAGMVAALQAERATLEARSEALENQFAA
ncbi:MAG TPA: hypothetical protein DCY55_09115, partial [Gammaproteobacteria bacterium]|nr:hypothetical protein [Gammaproteobacteria bacterium]